MASILQIKFSASAVADETIDFLGDGSLLTFKAIRSRSGQVKIGADSATQTLNFYKSFVNDFNDRAIYTVTNQTNFINIEHIDSDHFDGFVDATHNNSGAEVTLTTTNQRVSLVTTVGFSEATTRKCERVIANISTNQDVEGLRITRTNLSDNSNEVELYNNASFDDDSHSVETLRGDFIIWVYSTLNGEEFVYTKLSPKTLIIEDLEINSTAFGGSVEIGINFFNGSENTLFALGSADNTDVGEYQASNSFNSLVADSYMAYAKDVYGCVRRAEFTIAESTSITSVLNEFFYSTKNSLRGAYRDIVGSASPYNFLLSEMPHDVPVQDFTHVFGDNQRPRIQFRSGYKSHRVEAVLCGLYDFGTELNPIVNIEFDKITDNIERNNYLGAYVDFNSDFLRTEISFTPENRYNEDGTIIGTHSYSGDLPIFYQIGTSIRIAGATAQIQEIREESGVRYAVLNQDLEIVNTSGVIVESVHLEEPYEDFEYHLDLSVLNTTFYVNTYGTKNNGQEVLLHTTEKVRVITQEELESGWYHQCSFYNNASDNEVNYAPIRPENSISFSVDRSIKHLRNLKFISVMTPIIDADIDSEKLDNRVKKLDYTTNDIYELHLDVMPTEVAKTVCDSFNKNEYVNIDGILATTLDAAELKNMGQLAEVKVKIAVVNLSSRFDSSIYGVQSYDSRYHVVTP